MIWESFMQQSNAMLVIPIAGGFVLGLLSLGLHPTGTCTANIKCSVPMAPMQCLLQLRSLSCFCTRLHSQ